MSMIMVIKMIIMMIMMMIMMMPGCPATHRGCRGSHGGGRALTGDCSSHIIRW